MDSQPNKCGDHDILIRLDENVKAIKEDVGRLEGLSDRVKTLEERSKIHSKILAWGGTLLTGLIVLLARAAWAGSLFK